MAIRRTDPLRDLLQLKQSINRMFEDTLSRSATAGATTSSDGGSWTPPLDLFEEAGSYVLRVDLPGVDSDDVEVRVEEDRLVVRGQRRIESEVARESYLRVERPAGPFSVQLALPGSIDAAKIRATQRNGVLEVVLPRRSEAAAGRIEVARA